MALASLTLWTDTNSLSTGRQPLTHVIHNILERRNYAGAQYERKSELNTAPSLS